MDARHCRRTLVRLPSCPHHHFSGDLGVTRSTTSCGARPHSHALDLCLDFCVCRRFRAVDPRLPRRVSGTYREERLSGLPEKRAWAYGRALPAFIPTCRGTRARRDSSDGFGTASSSLVLAAIALDVLFTRAALGAGSRDRRADGLLASPRRLLPPRPPRLPFAICRPALAEHAPAALERHCSLPGVAHVVVPNLRQDGTFSRARLPASPRATRREPFAGNHRAGRLIAPLPTIDVLLAHPSRELRTSSRRISHAPALAAPPRLRRGTALAGTGLSAPRPSR